MIEKTIQLYTEKEEEFVNLLVRIGTKKTIAKTLVFLGRLKRATSRELEHGTDLRQPEVSVAMKYLEEQGWIKRWRTPSDKKGRPVWNYALAIPVPEIMSSIEKQKKTEVNNQLALIKKMRKYI
jgi:predicted transcriptional regulator